MLIPFLKISAHYSASDRAVKKARKIKTQRLKSESSGDWQKERSNPQKIKSSKTKGLKKGVQNKEFKKETH